MKATILTAAACLSMLCLLAPSASAQGGASQPGPKPGGNGGLSQPGTPDGSGPGAGGNWGGPGDTVTPGGGGGSGGPLVPPAGPTAPNSGGGYLGDSGDNPFGPQMPPPGVEGAPGSPGEPPPPKPTTPPRTDTLNSWQTWWHYNRWAHLEVEASILADTGSGGFFLGHGEKAGMSPLLRATKNQVREIVQPALTRALERGGHADFVTHTLHALAKIRGVPLPEDVPAFEEVAKHFMKAANQYISEKAVLALGIRGDDSYLPLLAAILADAPEGRTLVGRSLVNERTRAFAAYALGLLGERTKEPGIRVGVYDALMSALPGERDEVQAACLLALGFVPMPTGETFVEGGELYKGKTRIDQVLALLEFFKDDDQSYLARSQAPNALARLAVDAPESLRTGVAYALLTASSPLSSEQREIQNAAVIALGKLGNSGTESIDEEIRNHLEKVAYRSSGDRSTRYLAMVALAEVASRPGAGEEPFAGLEPTRRLLQQYVRRMRGETQAWSAIALGILEEDAGSRGEVASPDTAKVLETALVKTRSSEVAGALAIAMGMARDPSVAEVLLERLEDTGDANMRGYAGLALGMIGVPVAVGPIRLVLEQSTNRPFVVENASIALALLGDQETGSRLFTVLDKSANPRVQSSVASAMGWIRDPRPLGDLCNTMIDNRRNDTARAWTAVAIGRICDEDRWPWVGRMSVDVQYDVSLPTLLEPIYETGLLDLP